MRVKILRVHTTQFLNFLKRDSRGRAVCAIVSNPLPDDAEVVRVGYDEVGWLQLVVQSSTFDDVPEGDRIPLLVAPDACLEYRERPFDALREEVEFRRRHPEYAGV